MSDSLTELDGSLHALSQTLQQLERVDLAHRIDAARVRIARPNTVVCVVGEFKQGKSSLVNGLVGQDICPVDDDIATAALTLIRYGETPGAIVRYRDEGDPDQVQLSDVQRFVTEAANRTDDRIVERVDVLVPSPLLADGLVIVDTPGMGGLGSGHAAATLSFLPFADGLLFVSDSSSELTATELDFLNQAREMCPNVAMVAPKTDISTNWRQIAELNRAHLEAQDLDVSLVSVSSVLRSEALSLRDRTLNERSGFPELLNILDVRVLAVAKATAQRRAVDEANAIVESVAAPLRSERAALDDPEAFEALQSSAADAAARLDALRSGTARWQSILGDRITDLSTQVTHTFREAMRETTRVTEEHIESLKNAAEWDEVARGLQAAVATAVADAYKSVELRRVDVRQEIASALAADDVIGPASYQSTTVLDTTSLWRARDLDPAESTSGQVAKSGFSGLRGAQSGVILLGVSTQFLPQAAALFVASNPVLLGAGALFGGFQIIEERKRRVQARRQHARAQLRQFTEECQFQVTNELTGLLREVQRDLRDEFVALIGELQTSWSNAAKHASQAASQGEHAMAARRAQVDEQLRDLQKFADMFGRQQ